MSKSDLPQSRLSRRSARVPAKSREMLYERLEDRVLFDAVPDGSLDPNAKELTNLDQTNAERFDTSLYAEDVKTLSDARLFAQDEVSQAENVRQELVIVDKSVDDHQQLVNDIPGEEDSGREIEVVTIDGTNDGIRQISQILSRYSDLDALHIVSHGDDVGINLGDTWLTRSNLGGYAAEVAQWGNALTEGGDLLFLGCDLASTADGRELLQSISTLTGADVAASIDDTGNAQRGGDWDLEFILGQMETSIAFSNEIQHNWKGLLAVGPDVTITTQNETAQIGDDVLFSVTFDNTAAAGSGDTGYGPFIDLLFPVNGADGGAGSDTQDGLDFVNATYLGQPVTATELTFADADGAYNDNGTSADTSDDTGTATVGYVSHPYLQSIQNELQFVSFSGTIDGGTLGIEFNGQSTTIDLTASSGVLTATNLQPELEGLSNIGVGDVSVTGDMADGFFIEFGGALAQTDTSQITLDNSLLENGGQTTNPHGSFAASTITDGSPTPQATKIYGTPGDKLVVLELPFGSVTPEQPEVPVIVNATMSNLADLYDAGRPETELTVTTRSGFRYGADALDNGEVDPPILSDGQANAKDWVRSASIRPSLITVETDIDGPEDETATGPNYPRTFSVTVDIPDGQTIENLDIRGLLPNNIVFLSLDSITSSDATTIFTTNVPSGTNVQGNPSNTSGFAGSNERPPVDITGARDGQSLVVTADTITGSAGHDVVMTFQAYATEFEADASGNPTSNSVISTNGDDDLAPSYSEHTASAVGDWIALDARDIGPSSVDNAVATPHSTPVDSKSLSVQKNVSVVGGGSFAAPGDILRYTLTFNISDYFTFGDLVLSDTFSDGQRFYNATGFEPVFSLADFANSYTNELFNVHVGALTAAATELATDNFIVDQSQIDITDDATELGDGTYAGGAADPTNGSTTITVELSERLQQLGEDGILEGGHTHDGDTELFGNKRSSATGTITFYTEVQQDFSDDFQSGDRSVDHDDVLTNTVSITGSVRENSEDGSINNVIGTETDGSADSVSVEVGTLTKGIYAINGNTSLPPVASLQPGDNVTYRLTYTLPSSDFEDLVLTDYLPLPALVAVDFNADDFEQDVWSFDSDSVFDATPGVVELGPNDTFFNSDPGRSDFFSATNITIDESANSLEFDFGTYDDPSNQSTLIELLFTVTVQDDPFADGLFLTNIARAEFGATNQTTQPTDALVPIDLGQPDLKIIKGIVANDAGIVLDPNLIGPVANSEFQVLTYTGSDLTATFSLTFDGQTTGQLPVTASAADVQIALESLPNIGKSVTVTGTQVNQDPLVIEFGGALAQTDVSEITVAAASYSVSSDNSSSNEMQTISGNGTSVGGTLTLTFRGQTTGPIPYNANSGTIQSALESLSSIGAGNVIATGGILTSSPVVVEFIGALAAMDVPEMAVNNSGLSPAPATVSTDIEGGDAVTINGVGAATPFTGRITSSALAGQAIDLDVMDGIEGGDTVRFMIVVENSGTGKNGAFDIQVRDQLPAEFEYVAGSLSVVDGQGDAISFTNKGIHPEHALFGSGIQFDDPGVTPAQVDGTDGGALDPYSASDGRNIAVITYDAKLVDEVAVQNDNVSGGEEIANQAVLVRYAGREGAEDHTASRDEVQTLTTNDTLIGGTFTLTYEGQTTAPIAWNANSSDIQAALQSLGTIGAGGVIVTGDTVSDGPVSIRFAAALGDTNVSEIVFDDTNLVALAITDELNGAQNEVQTIHTTGNITGGAFTLTFNGETTATLGFNAGAATIQTALESLSAIGVGDINVTGGALPGTAVQVEFTGALAAQDVGEITFDDASLSGGGSLTVSTTTPGSQNEFQTLDTSGPVTGGTFTLTLGGQTTSAISHNASAATIQSALEALSSVGVGNVTVTGGSLPGTPVVVEFVGKLTGQNVAQMVVDGSALVKDGVLSLATTTHGSYNEQQRLSTTGTVTGGDFTLSFNGETTTPIAWNADAATVRAALETLNAIPGGSVIVTGGSLPGTDIQIEFTGALTQQNVSAIVVDDAGLVGGPLNQSTLGNGQSLDPKDDAFVTIREGSLTKSIELTSEAHTGVVDSLERVTIGEIVRYRIEVELPGGTNSNVRVYDKMPTGLVYVDDGSATLKFVSDTPGTITSSTLLPGILPDEAVSRHVTQNRDDYTSGLDVWFNLGDVSNTEADANAEYAVIEFNALVMNNTSANRGDSKYNDAELWVDGVEVFDIDSSDQPRFIVAEPNISAPQKQVSDGAGSWVETFTADASDTVGFRVTFSNGTGSSDSDAFHVNLTDSLPDQMSFDDGSIEIYVDGALLVSGFTDSSSAATDTIDVTIDRVGKGQTVEIRYSVTMDDTVVPTETLSSPATVTWTNLPGNFGTSNGTGGNTTGSDLASLNNLDTNASGKDDAAGISYETDSGDQHGERDGSGFGVAPNDYHRTDTASVSVDGTTIGKTLDGTSINDSAGARNNVANEAVIGEHVTYTVTLDFSEGVMANAQLIDTLDPGLAFVGVTGSTVSNVTLNGTVDLTSPVISNNGRTITWDLETITDTTAGDASGSGDTDGQITITYTAVITNVIGNQSNVTRNNIATFTFDDDPGNAPNPRESRSATAEDVSLIEPEITVTKSVALNTDGDKFYDDGKVGDAGDGVQYTITLTNSSGVDAFNIDFSDGLPTLSGGRSAILSPTFIVSDTATSGAVSTSDFELVGSDLAGWTLQKKTAVNIDMLASQLDIRSHERVITFTVEGIIDGNVSPNQAIGNTATVDWSSMDGKVADPSAYTSDDTERSGADGEGPANLNNYEHSASDTFAITTPVFTRYLFATNQTETSGSNVTIGEVVTYALVVSIPEGVAPDATIVDQLPDGLNYTGYRIETTAAASVDYLGTQLLAKDFNGGLTGGLPAVTGGIASGDDVTFTFGQIDVGVDNDPSNNAFLLIVDAVVNTDATNTGYSGSQRILTNNATIDFSTDGESPQAAGAVDVTVVEPSLAISKEFGTAVDIDKADSGDTMSVVLTVDNTAGTSTAYEVAVEDTLNPLHYDLSTMNFGAAGSRYPADFAVSYNSTSGLLRYSGGDIAAGASVTFTFTIDLLDTPTPGTTLLNTATITDGSTLEGTVAGERNTPDADGDGSDVDSDTVQIRRNSLAGNVWDDTNNDGVYDGSESGIGSVDIRLTGTDHHSNSVDMTMQTLADGSYLFDNLRPGTYAIQQDPNGDSISSVYLDGKDNIGTPGGLDVINDLFFNVNLPTGTETHGANNDFGEILASSLAGSVFHDADNDGTRDGGETGIAGVTIRLQGMNDLGTAVDTTITTLADGSYQFTDLRPGTYSITETTPGTHLDGRENDGSLANGDATANDVISSIDVVPGDTGTNYNFGEVIASTLSGYVYHDSDNDGDRSGEIGLRGVTVRLTGTDDLGNSVNLTTASNGSGYWEFTGLRPGTAAGYIITETQPGSHLDGKDTIGTPGGVNTVNDVYSGVVVVSNTTGTENNFGELEAASLSGVVIEDHDNDGNQDAGEGGIGGVEIRLTGTDDLGHSVSTTINTNSDGTYSFDNLRPGTYQIAQTQPTTHNDGKDADGSLANGDTTTNDTISSIIVVSGDTGTTYTFAELPKASLSGFVFHDSDNDGSRSGESGINGVAVSLTGTDDLGNAVSLSTTTNASGFWEFAGLRPSNASGYTIAETQPGTHLDGRDSDGSLANGSTSSNDIVSGVNVVVGATGTEYNFAELEPASISGRVYEDGDQSGAFNGSEAGIGGVQIRLTGTDDLGNSIDATTNTAATTGQYSFANLRPGDYTITQTQPTTHLDADETIGSEGGTNGTNDVIGGISIAPGEAGTNYDFGEYQPGRIAGFVFDDTNNDGKFDGSESGLIGVNVKLTGKDDRNVDVNLTVTTGVGGAYKFTDLRPGTYNLEETTPGTHLDGIDTEGSLANGDTSVNDRVSSIDVIPDDNGTGYNFAEIQPASLSGAVYHDADNDGVRDGGESLINGVSIRLTGTNDLGQSVDTTRPATGGLYTFSNLRPSNTAGYTLTQVNEPAGFLDGKDSDGSLANGDISTNNVVSSVNVAPGNTATSYNFGEVIPSTLSGYVYHDSDNDGIRSDEPVTNGVQNSRITLSGTDDLGNAVNTFVDTDANGFFEFANLRPSNAAGYILTQTTVPTGFIDGRDSIGTPGGVDTVNNVFSGIVVPSNTSGTENNFAELVPASLSGTVFNDHDNDGSFEPADGETGIAGVAIRIQGTDDLGNAVDTTINTDSSGNYTFSNLRPSDAAGYSLTETHPSAYSDGTDSDGSLANGVVANDIVTSINLSSGDVGANYYFGEQGTSISGTIYVDDDRDGALEAVEGVRVGDVTVQLFDMTVSTSPVLVDTVISNADGTYSFDHLPAGDYRIVQTQPTQYGTTSPNTVDLTLPLTGSTGNNFGESLFDIGNVVYFDADGSGTQNGTEEGVGGVDVTLQYAGINGIFGDGDDPPVQTVKTAADGTYRFTELFNGKYTVTVRQSDLPADMTGTDETDDSSVAIDGTSNIEISNVDRFDVDFGYKGALTIGDAFWYDIDGSGSRNQIDSGGDGTVDTLEPGLAGITVNLTFAGADDNFTTIGDNLTLSTTTGADGAYSFDNLPEGEFQVSYFASGIPSGLSATIEADDSAAAVDGLSNISLSTDRSDVDFGFAGDYALGDLVWFDIDGDKSRNQYDSNGDAVADTDEPVFAAVDVTIVWAGFDNDIATTTDNAVFRTTTDANGAYSFSGLLDGVYQVSLDAADLPAAMTQTREVDGTTNNSADVTISGSDRSDVDFGFHDNGVISNQLWHDVNADGIFNQYDSDGDSATDSDEPGLAGVTVTALFAGADGISGNADDFSLTAVSAADGTYRFSNLPQGNYTITVDTSDLPTGSTSTFDKDDFGTAANDGVSTVALSDAETDDGVDFGYRGNHSVGEVVWFDRDGVQDALNTLTGEPGFGGVIVELTFAGADGNFDTTANNVVLITTTSATGAFSFSNLFDGDYQISVVSSSLPTAMTQTYEVDGLAIGNLNGRSDFSLAGGNRTDIDFGYIGNTGLSDTVWHDVDGSGTKEAGEPGLNLIDVNLQFAGANDVFGDADDFLLQTTTDINGLYSFSNLPEGEYRIAVAGADLPSGMNVITAETDDSAAAEDGTSNISLNADRTDVDFGFRGARTLGDRIWFDGNGDGIQDATNEPGLGDIRVNLLFAGQDGIFSTVDDVTIQSTTDASGNYSFADLPDGDFRISVETSDLPAGMIETFEVDGTRNNQADVQITGTDLNNVDFGFRGTGTISNRVWHDVDGDGKQESGEPGMVGITVNLGFAGEDGLFGTTDDFSLTAVTGADGAYSFNQLPPGEYRIDIDETGLPVSHTQSFEQDDFNNNILGTAEVSLTNGRVRTDIDFGYEGALSIGNRVWFEADGDGIQDGGEPGLGNIGVTLIFAGPDADFAATADNVTLSATTDSDGEYTFSKLLDGDYRVVITTTDLPGGAIQTFDQDDATFGAASLDDISGIRLTAAGRSDADFGYKGNSSIGGLIFFDANNNGIVDAGDRGLSGIDITADVDIDGDANVDYTVTVTTGINGEYQFDNLILGTYTVTVDSSQLPPGMAANRTLDPDDGTAHSAAVLLGANDDNDKINFGYRGDSSIGDRVWLDTDGDRIQDELNEPGLANVDVILTWFGPNGVANSGPGSDDEVFTVKTDDNGNYEFEFLPEGIYSIDIEQSDVASNTILTTVDDPTTLALAEGTAIDTIDFGFLGGGSIGDRIFYDFNGDGVENGDDVGYADVEVTIITDLDNDGIDESFTTTTDSTGSYEVPGLPYGSYKVTVTAPNGTATSYDTDGKATANTSVVVLNGSNASSDSQDFGLTGTGSVGDTVFYDEDGNGVQHGDEVGIPGVTVRIDVDLNGNGISDFNTTATTDDDGRYSFSNIPEGDVTLTVTTPVGADPTTNHEGRPGGENVNEVTLTAGGTDHTSDFGYLGNGSIGNTVFFDADGDGTYDDGNGADPAEPGLPGVQVFLDIDFNGDGTIDRTLKTRTGLDGSYSFDNLPSGQFTVRATQPVGAAPTVDGSGTPDNESSLILGDGENNTNQNFGYTGNSTGQISDTVFFDINNDGVDDTTTTDRGLAGVDVTLSIDLNDDGVADYTDSVPTDSNGNFTFTNLIPGTYTITTDPADMPSGLANNPTVDLDGTATQHEADYEVNAGVTTGGPGFGFHATPDYDVTKTGNGNLTSAMPGDTVSYTIIVKNAGELDGRDVTITDTYPTDVLNITNASGGTINTSTGEIKWNLRAMLPGDQVMLTVTATLLDPVAAGIHDFTNSVTVDDDHYNGDDPDATNNTSAWTADLDAAPDYTITKTDGAAVDTLSPGDRTTYTITVTNNGNQDGRNVVVTDRFPVGVLAIHDAMGGTADAANGTITWNIGDVNVGDTVVLQPVFDVISPGRAALHDFINQADVMDDGANGTDSNPSNNTANDRNRLDAAPNYRISKSMNGVPAEVVPGDSVTYSILVENIGDQNGTGVIVTDSFPAETLTNLAAPGAIIDTTTGRITWDIGDLNGNGDSVLLTVTAQVRNTLPSGLHYLTNNVSVTDDLANGADPDTTNNFDNDITPLVASPDLTISVSDDDAEGVRPGESVVFTIDFENSGQQDATGIVITETVPAGSEFEPNRSTPGWIDHGSGTFTFDVTSLSAGDKGTLEFAVTVNELPDPNREHLHNAVSIMDDGTNGPDHSPDNNFAEDVTPLQVFSFDSFQNFCNSSNKLTAINRNQSIGWLETNDPFRHRLRPLPIDTVYTGIVDPGTTLSGKIYDEQGRLIGEQVVVADSAGNWLMQFPTVVLFEAPHEMRVDQTLAVQNSMFDAGFNLRRFFHPAIHTQLYVNEPVSLGAAFHHNPSSVLEAMHAANNDPLGFDWKHHAYQLIVSSTNPSAM